MNSRTSWFWVVVAAGLFAFILFFQRYSRHLPSGPLKVLPNLKAASVTSVQVRPAGQWQIRAQRTNGLWQLTEPISYPAQAASVQDLLTALERLTPATYIARQELKNRPQADEEYGFGAPQATIILQQGDYFAHLLIGTRTAPGDQVFLQVVGDEGVHVVDAELLKYIPRNKNDWRDRRFCDLTAAAFDRLGVTNGGKMFELQRDGANDLWRIVTPGFQARANHARIQELLQGLQQVRIREFVSDEPAADLEPFGLQVPQFQLTFKQNTNTIASLQFGKSPTNDANQLYARRLSQNGVVTVARDLLAPWLVSVSEFRDPHLVAIADPAGPAIAAVEIRGHENFSLVRSNLDSWRVLPQNFPADAALVKDLLASLGGMQIVQFVKDVVTEPDLPAYGLTSAGTQYILKSAATNSPAGTGYVPIASLTFGTNQDDKIFVRRTDESSVYAVKLEDFQHLGSESWQFRDRQIWDFGETNVAGVTIRQQGKLRQILRKAQYQWALAPGSQGFVEPLSTEETVRGLCHLAAAGWLAHGQDHRAAFGFTNLHEVTLELKNGENLSVEFGALSPSGFPFAGVTFEGDFWIFDFPWKLCQDVLTYLKIPADAP
jgi:hypothetical protein